MRRFASISRGALGSLGALALLVASMGAGACGEPGSAAAPSPGAPIAPATGTLAPADAATSLGDPLVLDDPPVDVVGTDGALDEWPRIVPGVDAHAFTSHDRADGNDDGFSGAYSELYKDERGEHVVFDALGPGVLRTLWFTGNVDGNGRLFEKKLRFYLDGETQPRFELDANALYAGANPPFVKPLVADNRISSGGFASWVPVVFAKRLRVTTEERAGFYQAHYETFPADWKVRSTRFNAPAPGRLVERFSRTGFSTLPLTVVPLDTTKSGAGTIDVLRFEPDAAPSVGDLKSARIRIWFDGRTDAQVDVPLGMFFGSGLGETTIRAVPWTMEPGRYESRFPMPYWEGFRIEVTGLAGALSLHLAPPRLPRAGHGSFEAIFRASTPTAPGADFVYADVTGAGKIVATVLTVEPLSATDKQWWEGDLRSSVDDVGTPSILGTGHEDDYLGGWSNEFLERPFTQPMQGCPKTVLLDVVAGTQYNADATMYRLYPGITFLRRARHTTEHGSGNAKQADYASVTFLYRQARSRLAKTDELLAPAEGSDPPGGILVSSHFDGERVGRNATALTATRRDYTRPFTFRVAVASDNVGVKLRRVFDQLVPRQRARVEVDGVVVGSWYVAESSDSRRWAERDFFVPARLTQGKSAITVKVVPEGPFNAARFEAWSVLP